MAERESAAAERGSGETDGNKEADCNQMVSSSKPLHRFVKGEPRCVGIVILFFGCAEVLMGFVLARVEYETSNYIYVPFWQGALFLISGNLSIYTEIHPSKKMVTVCLAMYIVALLGLPVSIGCRIRYLSLFDNERRYPESYIEPEWAFIQFFFSSS
ncbi:membrane-spanning 4-domains subfamily A member 15 isoform X2 [Lampris incognitus]|uniref:membrane-spanning 4-domains subfamily A member 15 isoform X2 n=1 Tax=Lampris incognitus TaxID=2546036 RepID=UPI0024B58A43|nr:membrane-spanning 4-domains subfamily A member 15 isoform X2 [Lampris incognitus]